VNTAWQSRMLVTAWLAGVAATGCAHAPSALPPKAARPPAVCVCFKAAAEEPCIDGAAGENAQPRATFSHSVLQSLEAHALAARISSPDACGAGPFVALSGIFLGDGDPPDEIEALLTVRPGESPTDPVGALYVTIHGRPVKALLDTRAVNLGQYATTPESSAPSGTPAWLANYVAGVVAYLEGARSVPGGYERALASLRQWEKDVRATGAAASDEAQAYALQLRGLVLMRGSCDEEEDPVMLLRRAHRLVPYSIDARKLVVAATLSRIYGVTPSCAEPLERELLASLLLSPSDESTSKDLGSLYDLMSERPPESFVPGTEIALKPAVQRRLLVPSADRPAHPMGFEVGAGGGVASVAGPRTALPEVRTELAYGRNLAGFGVTLGLVLRPEDQVIQFGGGNAHWSRQSMSLGPRWRWELPSLGGSLPPFVEGRLDGLLGLTRVEGSDYPSVDPPSHAVDGGVAASLRPAFRWRGVGIWAEGSFAGWLRPESVTVVQNGVVVTGPRLPRTSASVLLGVYARVGD
jgi:hypothetical protein